MNDLFKLEAGPVDLYLHIGLADASNGGNFSVGEIATYSEGEKISFILLKLLHGQKHVAIFLTYHKGLFLITRAICLVSLKLSFVPLSASMVEKSVTGYGVKKWETWRFLAVMLKVAREALLHNIT